MQEPSEEPFEPQALDRRHALVPTERTHATDVRVHERLERTAGEDRLDVGRDSLALTEAMLRGGRGHPPGGHVGNGGRVAGAPGALDTLDPKGSVDEQAALLVDRKRRLASEG